LRKEERRKT